MQKKPTTTTTTGSSSDTTSPGMSHLDPGFVSRTKAQIEQYRDVIAAHDKAGEDSIMS